MSLENLRIASPCHVAWSEMDGSETKRFCAHCKLNVYNLSGMARDEAEKLVAGAEGRLCVRFYARKDGTVLTKDCPVGIRKLRRKAALAWSGAAAMLLGLFGCKPSEFIMGAPAVQGEAAPPKTTMGKVANPVPTMGIVAMPKTSNEAK